MENVSDSSSDTPKKPTFLFWGAIVVIAILFILLIILSIGIMIRPSVECFFMNLTGTKNKLELLQFIGWVISGLIAICGVIGLVQRAEALDKQNKINEKNHNKQAQALNRQHEMVEKGHVHERFKTATDHLGSERILVRIAAFNEFYHIVEIEPTMQNTIFNILFAHLEKTISHENYQQEAKIKPTAEVQSLLNVLFKPDNKDNFIFAGMVADLEKVYLPGANLQNANLQEANLQNANLQNANLQKANLQNAHLQEAILQNAKLASADLQDARMFNTQLQKASLSGAKLQKAYMTKANLQNAHLNGAKLQGAYLEEANLQGALMLGANLQGARITQTTKMSDGWKEDVEKDNTGKTGVLVVKNRMAMKIIEHL